MPRPGPALATALVALVCAACSVGSGEPEASSDVAAYCAEVEALASAGEALADATDPLEVQRELDRSLQLIESARDVAPTEVGSDLGVLALAIDDFATNLSIEALTSADVAEASARVHEFNADACGLSLPLDSYADLPDAAGVPLIERNFIEACIEAGPDTGVDEAALGQFCECSFEEISATVPFEDFAQLDETLRGDPGAAIPDEVRQAIAGCIARATADDPEAD